MADCRLDGRLRLKIGTKNLTKNLGKDLAELCTKFEAQLFHHNDLAFIRITHGLPLGHDIRGIEGVAQRGPYAS